MFYKGKKRNRNS